MDQNTILIIAAAVVLLALIATVWLIRRTRHSQQRSSQARIEGARNRYGPEFDRQSERMGNTDQANSAFQERAQNVKQRQLSPSERQRYREDWERIEAQFLDRPALALAEAERLVSDLMRDRGYRADDPNDAAMDLAVTRDGIAERYRSGRDVVQSQSTDLGSLREAMLHFRTVVDDLLAVDVRGEQGRVEGY
jgi:FtsZ-interacting cell division protein ZipA